MIYFFKFAFIGWLIFFWGCLKLIPYYPQISEHYYVLSSIGLVFIIGGYVYLRNIFQLRTWLDQFLDKHTRKIQEMPSDNIGLWIALFTGLGLFMELLVIRLHSSYFEIFAYFKNISLLSCFLGLGIGYSVGDKKRLFTPFVFPLLMGQIAFMLYIRYATIGDILQNPISEQLTMGLGQTTDFGEMLVVYGMLMFIFTLNASLFYPLGQLGSVLMKKTEKLESYNWNLLGSILGVLVFMYLSFIWTPPIVWIMIAGLLFTLCLRSHLSAQIIHILSLIILVIILGAPRDLKSIEIFSPYQILNLGVSSKQHFHLSTSNTYFQKLLDLSPEQVKRDKHFQLWSQYYALPYNFKKEPEDVLIVGSGTGNDVAAALRNGASHIDAVEIDPAILELGKLFHPEDPYSSPKVNIIVNDARAFIRQSDKKYDLISYGLLDSHTLLSGRSGGIRLDSYVYTVEGFRDARKRLKPKGVISLTFCILSEQLGRKIYLMLEKAFDGKSPRVYFSKYDSGFSFIVSENVSALQYHSEDIVDVTKMFNTKTIVADLSTDDWPFLYMPIRKYPVSYLAMIIILLATSFFIIKAEVGAKKGKFSLPCFLLGIGFMLIETKGMTELALVYGSTWLVMSVVIAAILIMAFFANTIVLKIGRPPLKLTYTLLIGSILIGYCVTFVDLSNISPIMGYFLVPIVLTLPLFFSGFAFSSELVQTESISVALYSNLMGAMIGGFLEYNSMHLGFRSLYIIAAIVYLLSFLFSKRVANIRSE